MVSTHKSQLGILALLIFALGATVLAFIAPRLPDPTDSSFLAELEDASHYALINFLFVGVYILSIFGAYTIPHTLRNTQGAEIAVWGWWVYLVGAVLLCAFIAADGVFIQMMRILSLEYEYQVPADAALTPQLARDYMNVAEVRYLGIAASIVWSAGLALLAWAIYLAESTPLSIDGPIVAGVILLILSMVLDSAALAGLGYLGIAIGFGVWGYHVWQKETSAAVPNET